MNHEPHSASYTATMKTPLLSAILLVAGISASASAQLVPDRLYYGVDRPIPMTVKVPDGKAGDVQIELLEADTAKVLASAAAQAGGVNLATLFPNLWADKKPDVVFAQLKVGDERIGAAVVIQPMVDRGTATLNPATKLPQFRMNGQAYSGIRAYSEKHVLLDTTAGEIELAMRPDQAPNSAFNFMSLAGGGFYTDVIFHRVLNQSPAGGGFVVQVGDPTGTGSGGPGFQVDLEYSKLKHDYGVLSMARSGDPNSNGSQIFICLSRAGCQHLDGAYTAFGQAVKGAEAIKAIAETPVGADGLGRPKEPPKINKATLIDAPPYGTGPKPLTPPTTEATPR